MTTDGLRPCSEPLLGVPFGMALPDCGPPMLTPFTGVSTFCEEATAGAAVLVVAVLTDEVSERPGSCAGTTPEA